ncbi:MAG: hypothetical protein J0G32_03670 [Alphaproteobacteria bacterium]|nr:hypothetical protein [Alphaproteobacteria bacterium]OJV16052.1 MAG: hypothetical protein BGO27_04315 [Alphaproteobacteria bacterium 33-17]
MNLLNRSYREQLKNNNIIIEQATTLDGRKVWYIIEVCEHRKPLLCHYPKGKVIDINDIGRILKSGWGEFPDDEVLKDFL